jgi:hypothetical protein
MSWVAVAVGGASLVTGYMGSKASKDAARAQGQGADAAAQVQWDMYNQSRSDNEPFRQAGLTGLQEYMALLGLPTSSVAQSVQQSTMPTEWFGSGDVPTANPSLYNSDPAYRAAWDTVSGYHKGRFDRTSDRNALENHMRAVYNEHRPAQQGGYSASPGVSLTQQQAFDRFRNTPGYQFGLTEGQRTLESSAAASGGLFSGKAAKALTKFGQDYADQQGYRPYMNSLASLAGIGQTATSQNSSLGMQAAGNVGNAYQNAGAARASGIVGSANAWGNALGQGAGILGYMYGGRSNNPYSYANNPGYIGPVTRQPINL